MRLCDLPDDVLRLVLQAAAQCHRAMPESLKANLPLLAVCQRWRGLALALVYDRVNIKHHAKVGGGEYGSGLGGRPLETKPAKTEMTSNLDLVVSAGCVQAIKEVHINVRYRLSPLPGLKSVAQAIHDAAEEWRGARVLRIGLDSVDRWSNEETDSATIYADEISQICAALVAAMPGICRASFGSVERNHIARAFYGRLTEHYAGQLQKIHSTHSIDMSPDCLLRHIQKLTIYNDEHSPRLPGVDPAGLEELDLSNLPANHSWAPFGMGSKGEEIEFPRLKKLRVSYERAGTADGRPWRLYFPALKSLDLYCREGVCPFLEYMVLPPGMKRVSMIIYSGTLWRLPEIAPLTPEHFSLEIARGFESEPATMAAVNRILASVQSTKTIELSVRTRQIPVLPETITCTRLTHLALGAATSLDAMLGLIHKLPNLASMGLWELALDDIQGVILVPEPVGGCVVEPLDTRLKVVSINVDQNRPSWRMVTQAAKYLAAMIPTLFRFTAIHAPKKPIMSFVREYSELYPHLTGVNFTLNDSDDPFENRGCSRIEGPWREPIR